MLNGSTQVRVFEMTLLDEDWRNSFDGRYGPAYAVSDYPKMKAEYIEAKEKESDENRKRTRREWFERLQATSANNQERDEL